jgi:hypothetical protein
MVVMPLQVELVPQDGTMLLRLFLSVVGFVLMLLVVMPQMSLSCRWYIIAYADTSLRVVLGIRRQRAATGGVLLVSLVMLVGFA